MAGWKPLGVCHRDRRVVDIAELQCLLPGRGRHTAFDGPIVDSLSFDTPAIAYVHPDVSRLPERPADHGLVQVVNSYPLHGRVMIVVAATQDTCVPADKTTAVRAALAYVLSLLGQKEIRGQAGIHTLTIRLQPCIHPYGYTSPAYQSWMYGLQYCYPYQTQHLSDRHSNLRSLGCFLHAWIPGRHITASGFLNQSEQEHPLP